MPEKEKAAPVHHTPEAAQDNISSAILPTGADDRNCPRCGSKFVLISGNPVCSTCSSWRVWRSTSRISARAQEGGE